MRLVPVAAALLSLALLAGPAFAQSEEDVMEQIENLHGMSSEFGAFFGQIQDAFLFGEPTDIANLAAYPLRLQANGETYEILAADDLIDNFDSLVAQQTIDALASQDYADLIVTSDGVGFGNGVLWASNVCDDEDCASSQWLIISINN